MSDSPFSSARLGPIELKNRFIKAATFEGLTRDGVPGPRLTEFHRRIAEGGIAMTTLAYCATEADGRLHDKMMYLHAGIADPLRELVDQVHAAGARVSGQVVHCGAFSKNRKLERLKRPLGPSRGINLLGTAAGMPYAGAMNHDDIDVFVDTFRSASRLMKDVGFDAAEIHFGHGYGISQFISPKTNRRTDEYGGSLENRMRLPLRVLGAVREAVGGDLAIIGKMSMSDGVRGGVEWDEGVQVARLLDEAGIDGLVTSAGTSSFNPMLMFHGDSIAQGVIESESNPIARLGIQLVGKKMFRDYPYEEIYLRDHARRVRDAVGCAVVYIGGCSTRRSAETLLTDGFDFIQLGRTLLEDPDFVNHAQADPQYASACNHCNRCVGLIDSPDGIRCVLNHP